MKEGSFTGEFPELDFDMDDTFTIKKIKTPDQLPERLELAHVPEHVMRSGVIESLINQNDDLMSRLTVSLRRVGVLEDTVHEARTEAAKFKAKYENLNDQILILREQARVLAERARAGENRDREEDRKAAELKEQVQVLEIRYTELYAASQERQAKLEKELAATKTSGSRHAKYRRNIRRAAAMMKAELRSLREKRQSQEALLQNLRTNIAETTAYITNQAKDHKAEITKLGDAYEVELSLKRREIQDLSDKNRALAERTRDFDRLYNDKVKLENELIIAARKDEEGRQQVGIEISELQKSLFVSKNEVKELALQLEQKTAAYTESAATTKALSEEKDKLTEQVETLQLLWRDQQIQLEKSTEQKTALQKLNQELSISINEYRREVRELKERLEAEAQKAYSAHTAVEVALKAAKKDAADARAAEPVLKREDSLAPELLAKIDRALTEIIRS